MANKLEIYKCEICGNIVEVLHGGVGKLVCCNKPMRRFAENTVDAAVEKHVPVIEKTDAGIKVDVGSAPHPMAKEHYIEWVQILANGKAYRIFLEPETDPGGTFDIPQGEVVAREYCNVHGLWKSE